MAAVLECTGAGGNENFRENPKVKEFLVVGKKTTKHINNIINNAQDQKECKGETLKNLAAQILRKDKVLEVDSAVMSIVTRYVGCRAVLGDAADVVLQDALDRLDTLSRQIQEGSSDTDGRILKKRKSILLKKLQDDSFKHKAEIIGVFTNYKMEFIVGLAPACFDKNGKLRTDGSYRWKFTSAKTVMEPCPPSHKKAQTILHFGKLRLRNVGDHIIKSYTVYMEGDNPDSVLCILGKRRHPKSGAIFVQLVPPVEIPQQTVTNAQAAALNTPTATGKSTTATSATRSSGATSDNEDTTTVMDDSTDSGYKVKGGFFRNVMTYWWKRVGRKDSSSSCSGCSGSSVTSPSEQTHRARKQDLMSKPPGVGESNQSLGVSLY